MKLQPLSILIISSGLQACSGFAVKPAENSVELPLLTELWPQSVTAPENKAKNAELDSRALSQTITSISQQIESNQSSKIDLLDAIGYAQNSDAKFKAAQDTHRVSIADIGIARTRLYPKLTGEINATFDRIAETDTTNDSSTQEVSLRLVHPLFDKTLSVELTESLLKKSVADAKIQEAYENLITKVIKAYIAVLKAQSDIEFRQLDFNSIERQVTQSKKLFRLGSVTSTDIAEITAQQDLALAARIKAETDHAKAMEVFSALTGLPVTTTLSKLDLSIPLVPPNPNSIDAWVTLALKQNKLIQVDEETTKAARERVTLKRAERLPTLSLNGTASKFYGTEGFTDDDYNTSIDLTMDIDLFDGGRTSSAVAREKAAADAARHRADFTKTDETRKVKDHYHNVLSSIYTANALKQALNSNEAAIEAVAAGFKFGARTALELLRTRRAAFQSKNRMERSYLDYVESSLQLNLSAGVLSAKELQRLGKWIK